LACRSYSWRRRVSAALTAASDLLFFVWFIS
jgi:hypothetical protein